MRYSSTRDENISMTSAEAISQGISPEGGLLVPVEIPKLTLDDIRRFADLSYADLAFEILSRYLTDFDAAALKQCISAAYLGKFDNDMPAPVHALDSSTFMLELWHGPTCAFKDIALQLLPHLMTCSAGKTSEGKTMVILVATSGDTGKAALEGFRDVDRTKIVVFYPEEGVSALQKLQMTMQEGSNVYVFAMKGNFDEAQTGVKRIFTDPAIIDRLDQAGMRFSSANSINWGRLVPQIVYYVWAYCDLLRKGRIKLGDKINYVVPTGNFGNILAGYYAEKMGIPVGRFICASNKNKILTDFIRTGVYNRNRDFYMTASPSMDILVSSNLERLLYDLCGKNPGQVNAWMDSLRKTGAYSIDKETQSRLTKLFYGGYCDERNTLLEIKRIYDENGYLCDTHTAVAAHVYRDYKSLTGDNRPSVIVSTANPFKFPAAVLSALQKDISRHTEFQAAEALSKMTGWKIPAQLASLSDKKERFTESCTGDTMAGALISALKIK